MTQPNEFSFKRTWGPKINYPMVLEYQPPERPFIKIAGPCSVESREHIRTMAKIVSECGATHLRGGLFRAGTYPGSNFGWVDKKLIEASYEAAEWHGLQNIVEILDYGDRQSFNHVIQHAHCLQVGARQMQNYTLLTELAMTGKTIFLKRNPGSTMDEWLGSAEYIIKNGGHPVLIERGSSTHMNHVRWDLSISIIPAVKTVTRVPIVVDASHGTGRRDLVRWMTMAGVAAGADGCLVEVHSDPENSLSDADQAVCPLEYQMLMERVNIIRGALL